MIRKKCNVSDSMYKQIIKPVECKVRNHVKKTFLNKYAAYHFAEYYNNDAIWDQPFKQAMNTAVEDLSQFNYNDLDFEEVKKELLENYGLKVISESPLIIEEL